MVGGRSKVDSPAGHLDEFLYLGMGWQEGRVGEEGCNYR